MDAREAEADTPLPCLCAMMPAKWISCWNGYSNKCANDVTKQQASLDDTSVAGKGAKLVQKLYDHLTTKSRLRGAWQAEKEDRSSNEKESKIVSTAGPSTAAAPTFKLT
eukprot:1139857-Pelagomonas_calceolata.AAC.1